MKLIIGADLVPTESNSYSFALEKQIPSWSRRSKRLSVKRVIRALFLKYFTWNVLPNKTR